jgi:HEPN domain-containing protein
LRLLPELIASYLQLANQNLEDARLLRANGSRNSVYHYSQAAEFLFRSVMSANNIRIPHNESHLTSRMWTSIPDGPIKLALKKVTWLDSYSTAYRYPSDSGRIKSPPDDVKLAEADTDINHILKLLLQHFDYNIDDPGQKSIGNLATLTFPS